MFYQFRYWGTEHILFLHATPSAWGKLADVEGGIAGDCTRLRGMARIAHCHVWMGQDYLKTSHASKWGHRIHKCHA